MTIVNQHENLVACSRCGAAIVERLKTTHRDVCPAAVKNSFRQYRDTHGGQHIALDEHLEKIDTTLSTHNQDVTRIDTDYNAIFNRVEELEQRAPSTTAPTAGVPMAEFDPGDSDDEATPPNTGTSLAGPYQPLT